MSLSTFLFAVIFWTATNPAELLLDNILLTNITKNHMFILSNLALFYFFFNTGFGPMKFTLLGELFSATEQVHYNTNQTSPYIYRKPWLAWQVSSHGSPDSSPPRFSICWCSTLVFLSSLWASPVLVWLVLSSQSWWFLRLELKGLKRSQFHERTNIMTSRVSRPRLTLLSSKCWGNFQLSL